MKKIVPSTGETTVFVYDASGRSVAEYSTVVAPAQDAKVNYLTSDHLGSPRIKTDKNGAMISRNDYLPFGEDLFTPQRTQTLGYTTDTIRQKFTGYERDTETDLDFAKARMYLNRLGRFSIADPLLSSGKLGSPQSWNRYSYVVNNPSIATDPTGMYLCKSRNKDFCSAVDAAVERARTNLEKAKEKFGEKSTKYQKMLRAFNVLGDKGQNNGVYITQANGIGAARTMVAGIRDRKTDENPNGQRIVIEFDVGAENDTSDLEDGLLHEGSHAADGSDWVSRGFKGSPSAYQTELDAYSVGSYYAEARGDAKLVYNLDVDFRKMKGLDRYMAWPYRQEIWNASWEEVDRDTLRKAGIDHLLQYSPTYKLTSNDRTRSFKKGGSVKIPK